MQIRNFVRESFIDYSGKVSSIVFSPGCNYKCPACHAKHLLEKGKNIGETIVRAKFGSWSIFEHKLKNSLKTYGSLITFWRKRR